MFRKRKQPTPSYRLPPPYQPMSGEQAALQIPGVYPYAAMMQVAAADTHQDYVICRGFDIRVNKFVDYEAGNADKPGISVAKPYDKRQIGNYEIAQIFLAFLPLQSSNPSPTAVPWRVGQNPGVSEVTPGHPASLSERVDELQDAESKLVNWMLVDSGGGRDRARWVQATLVDKMCCQTGTFAVSNPVNLDNDDDVSDVTEAENDFKLQATAGSTVLLKWRYPTDDWLIVQVLHQCEDMIFDIRYDGGCVIEKNTTEVSYMSCDPPTWKNAIAMYETDVLYDLEFDQQQCGIVGHYHRLCSFEPPAAGGSALVLQMYAQSVITSFSTTQPGNTCKINAHRHVHCLFEQTPAEGSDLTVATFQPVSAMVDLEFNNPAFDGYFQALYVLCYDIAEKIELFTGTDCSSSGSGSSQ